MSENIAINGRVTKTKSAFRMEYTVGINIQAKADKVWTIMTTATNFPRWNSTIKSMEGKIALGQTIKLVATLSPTRTFNLLVTEFEPGKRMVWSDGNVMFKGVRTYTVTSKPDGTTDFTMAEVYTGLMMPMIAGSLPDFTASFEQYVTDLKKEAIKK
jgi:hypothetical protein